MTKIYAVEPETGLSKVLIGAFFIDARRVMVAMGMERIDGYD